MTDKLPQPRSFLKNVEPYIGGREHVEGVLNPVKLSANENPLGASPDALACLRDVSNLALYPDGASAELRATLSQHFAIDPERIVCGNGSDEILHLLAQAFLEPGDQTISTKHAFLVYRLITEAAGAEAVSVDEQHLTADVDAMLAAVTDKTRMVFIANPNNPTGTMISPDELRRLHAGLRSDIILVIDGAYAEYVPESESENGFDLVDTYNNVVVTRTFSKVYGLAALRLGWGYFPMAISDVLNRIRPPFNVNSLAMRAGIAALKDQNHIKQSVQHNRQWREWLTQQISGLGFEVIPSQANFVLIRFASSDIAAAADHYLAQKGLILRAMGSYKLPDCLRLTVGLEEANRRVVEALAAFKDEL